MELKFLENVADAGVVIAAHPLAADNEGLGQSFAIYLAASQNMHSLLSKHCFCSAGSNLPFLPRTESAVVVGVELKDFWKLLLLDLGANAGGVDFVEVEVLDIAGMNLPLLQKFLWVCSR